MTDLSGKMIISNTTVLWKRRTDTFSFVNDIKRMQDEFLEKFYYTKEDPNPEEPFYSSKSFVLWLVLPYAFPKSQDKKAHYSHFLLTRSVEKNKCSSIKICYLFFVFQELLKSFLMFCRHLHCTKNNKCRT